MRALFMALPLAMSVAMPALAAGGGEAGDAVESQFVKLQPMIVPVLQENRMRGLVSVQVSLKLADPASREKVELLKPKLTDRYILTLNQLGQAVIAIDRPVNLPLIEQLLQRGTDQILGADIAHVLIIDASSRPR